VDTAYTSGVITTGGSPTKPRALHFSMAHGNERAVSSRPMACGRRSGCCRPMAIGRRRLMRWSGWAYADD